PSTTNPTMRATLNHACIARVERREGGGTCALWCAATARTSPPTVAMHVLTPAARPTVSGTMSPMDEDPVNEDSAVSRPSAQSVPTTTVRDTMAMVTSRQTARSRVSHADLSPRRYE